MSFEWLFHPLPIIVPAFVLVIYLWRCFSARRWPDIDKCIEIIAYGSGLYAACILVPKAFVMDEPSHSVRLALFTGAVVIGIASVRGSWIVLSTITSRVEPKAKNHTLHSNQDTVLK